MNRFGCLAVVGVIASAIAIFQFTTGIAWIGELFGGSPPSIRYQSSRRDINRSAITDYTRYVSDAASGNEDINLLASRAGGLFGNRRTLVMLNCHGINCQESSIFTTWMGETIINASYDVSRQHIILFTETRAIYINMLEDYLSETTYDATCAIRNFLVEKPEDRTFEDISVTSTNNQALITLRFSGWTCVKLKIGQSSLTLRPPAGWEINRFKSHRIEMSADRLGVLTLLRSTPL